MAIRTSSNLLEIPVREAVDFVCYIDEFGQDGRGGKFALAMILVPRSHMPTLNSFVRSVVEKVHQHQPDKLKVKEADWDEKQRVALCDLVRRHVWPHGGDCRDMSHPDWRKPDPEREKLFEALTAAGSLVGVDESVVGRVRRLYAKHHAYIEMYYDTLKRILNGLADGQTLVRSIEFVAHQRIPAELRDAVEFYAWVWLSRRYPHFRPLSQYAPDSRPIRFRPADEIEEPNLIVADALAHWWGMTQIDEKHVPGGREKYHAYLHRMDAKNSESYVPLIGEDPDPSG